MKFDPPILTEGPLSGAVFVVTHGKVMDPEKGHILASVKYDVTDQFEALAAKRAAKLTPTSEAAAMTTELSSESSDPGSA